MSNTKRWLDPASITPELQQLFWSRVDIAGPDDCWLWLASRKPSGYGHMNLPGQPRTGTTAHRMAYALTRGPVPPGVHTCHTCDNPPCCNPAHLFLGTSRDNQLDSIRKGRANRARGTQNAFAKLTEDDVQIIRATPSGYGSVIGLARRFNVSTMTIYKIRTGAKWAWVRGAA